MTIDREKGQNVLFASPVGGMDIEKMAHHQPDQVLILALAFRGIFSVIPPHTHCKIHGLDGNLAIQGTKIVNALVKAFIDTDASLLEINPLVETASKQLFALDAKLVIDDNALFRQPEFKALFDPTQVNPYEAKAQQIDLAYIALDGDIGCMVNGAGLAMSTMDLINYYGGRPANFLDVGGRGFKRKSG